ncbi:Complex III assembly protein translocase and chaperone [Sporothrix eucalyptigena]|uniref:Complex III assembly protein translocase and chaperone n=1 Tax=Sporothrix eucalyptigena TaxID=1812306 RepID=A0ABP0C600_9PEZI
MAVPDAIPLPSAAPTPDTPTTTPSPSSSSIFNLDALFENPVFAGGIGLAGLGAAAAAGRRGLISGAQMLRRRLLVNVEISRRDPSYPWVLAWLSEPRAPGGFLARRITRIHNLSVATATKSMNPAGGGHSSGGGNSLGDLGGDGPVQASFFLQPGYGRHIIQHRPGVFIAVSREKQSTANMATGEPHETVTLTTLYAHRHVFEEIFSQAHALAAQAAEGKTPVYSVQGMGWGALGEPRTKRPLASVVLDRDVKEHIVADVQDFLRRQPWYVDRGIPYRRGYLLYGPPGSGKTSFIQALAGELDFGLAVVNLSEIGMTDDKLAMLLMKLPRRSILLLEDADAAFVNRRASRDPDGYSGPTVTFSGLLNALDGVAAGEERIAFLTTNHIDRLDPALIRPGRVDMMVRIGEATAYQASQMWDRFYGDIDKDGSGRTRFLQRLRDLRLIEGQNEGDDSKDQSGVPRRHTSTAAIQGLFLFNKNDIEGAIGMVEGLIPRQFEPEPENPDGAIKTPA